MDITKIQSDFPILTRDIHGHKLTYLDNAATSQKPNQVIDSMVDYYRNHNANVHRGVHTLSDESTDMYVRARLTVANFIHAPKPEEIVFTRNTTESINIVASSWGVENIHEGDEIIVTELEHHSNLLPWQRLCQTTGARLIICQVDGNGDLVDEHLVSLVGKHTKLVCITQVSNVLGTIIDTQHLARTIKRTNNQVMILIDAAQSAPHMPIDISSLKIDFLTFSGHKMLGPQGIGCLWVRREILEALKPYLLGGGMISEVFEDHATWAELPDKFDAGTPNVAGAIGLAAACNYLDAIGMQTIAEYEQTLITYGLENFLKLETEGIITLYGPREPQKRAAILTFNITDVHAHDAAQILDREFGIAVRSGHHCNQLLAKKLGVPATVRASLYIYNTIEEIDLLVQGIKRVKEIIK
jgi:cysteine desulfurase/selenocysteine lyase